LNYASYPTGPTCRNQSRVLLIGEKLLQKIQYKPAMTTVFPAIEPLRADEAGDGMDLPQYNINIGGAQSFGVQVKRHGLRLKIAKRFVDESGSAVAGAGGGGRARSPRRHKEGKLLEFSAPSASSSATTRPKPASRRRSISRSRASRQTATKRTSSKAA
jgi:hypothetical protein